MLLCENSIYAEIGEKMKVLGVIPARYQSSRMPGKPLADICGKPMIWWVYREVSKSELLSDVVIATDDERIMNRCRELNLNCVMTSTSHDTPTARIAEVSKMIDADYYLTIMGDEPLVDSRCIELIVPNDVRLMYVAALSNELNNPTEVIDFSNQKVVTNKERRTLMISRSPIPYPKGTLDFIYEKVTGVQLFSKDALEFYMRTTKSSLEIAEENDLMRFVENGIDVIMIKSSYKTVSVDTPKDLEFVRKEIERR